MPETILGISAYYHDSAAALLVDGEIIAADHEERPVEEVLQDLRELRVDVRFHPGER